MWSPISTTLIYGQRDAVLVDAPMTIDQSARILEWVEASGKNLVAIYVTHGHGDHFFGAGRLLERYPQAKVLATEAVITLMKKQVSPDVMEALWNKRLPGQIPGRLVIAEPIKGDRFQLEGQDLIAVEVGHTDTADSTVLHIPSIGLVVAGDVAYNDVHQYLVESSPDKRKAWIAALDAVEALQPKAVIAGHKRESNDDSPRIIEESRQYIRDFDQICERTSTTLDLYEAMLALHPNRLNRGALWGSARAMKS
jgi:glyoxylase-like metal-dependent hydrolase (beta-lactamase superfamily II)